MRLHFTSKNEYTSLSNSDSPWCCKNCCNAEIPFNSTTDEVLKLTLQGKKINTNIFDPEQNMNVQFFKDLNATIPIEEHEFETNTQCPYLTLSEQRQWLNVLPSLKHSFVKSSQGWAKSLSWKFKHKIQFYWHLRNWAFQEQTCCYSYWWVHAHDCYTHDCYTESAKGGVRLYMSSNFNSIDRPEMESVVREIVTEEKQNYLIAVIYKHPNMPINKFNIAYSYL